MGMGCSECENMNTYRQDINLWDKIKENFYVALRIGFNCQGRGTVFTSPKALTTMAWNLLG